MLVPPGVKNANVVARKVKLKGLPPGECPPSVNGVALRRGKETLALKVTQESLRMRPNGWLLDWAGRLEGSGCLPPGKGLAAARLVGQALPAEKGREYALLNSRTHSTGRSDLLPWTKLRVTTAIFRQGAPPDAKVISDDEAIVEEAPRGLSLTLRTSDDFLGYEFAWYALRPRPDGGVRLELEFSETHVGEDTTHSETSRTPLQFGEDARYFRILVLTRVSDSDHNAALVFGSTLGELAARTRAVEADPSSCGRLPGCVAIDTQVALLPFVSVQVNRKEILAQPGATVRDALREAGETDLEAVTPTLRVERDYAGRLTPVEAEAGRRELLDLFLLGGEAISWQTKSGR